MSTRKAVRYSVDIAFLLRLISLQKDERARDTIAITMASKQQKVKSQLEAEKGDHQYNLQK